MNLTSNSEGNVVTFIPKTKKAYQQGLVLPFPIPAFDIESYLATAAIDCKFEVETAYPVESIKANFDRLMTRKSDGVYQLTSQEEDFVIEVQIYPYKHNQSKVLISSRIYNKKAHNGVVNVVKKIGKLKKQIQSVINS